MVRLYQRFEPGCDDKGRTLPTVEPCPHIAYGATGCIGEVDVAPSEHSKALLEARRYHALTS